MLLQRGWLIDEFGKRVYSLLPHNSGNVMNYFWGSYNCVSCQKRNWLHGSLYKQSNCTRSYWANLILVFCTVRIRCQDMMKTVFKTIQFETMPKYIRGLFQMMNIERHLRGSRKLVIPYVNTTTYGLHSFRYTSANMWNKLTEDLRSITSLNEFRNKICQVSFKHQCSCYLCLFYLFIYLFLGEISYP